MKILLRSTANWVAISFVTLWFLFATRVHAQLDETCVLTVNGQTVQVGLGGVFRFNNLIAGPNLFRAYAICTSNNQTRYGRSGFVQIVANQNFSLSELDFEWRDTPFPSVNTIQAVPDTPTLTAVGQTTQVRVNAFLSDGARKEVTTRAFGSTYISSNSEIVRVNENGLATAVAAGQAFITATNEGATAVASITVSPGDQLTTVQGFVLRQDETPVAGAQVNIQQSGTAVVGADGHFSISGVPTLLGPLTVTASSGDSLFGINSNIIPVPNGLTDAGVITLTKSVFWILNQSGNWNTAANWSDRAVPGANDNVVINVGNVITVTHSSGTHTVKSMQCDEAFTLSGGTFNLSSTSEINGTFTMSGNLVLGGAGELGVNGLFAWSSGDMLGSGRTVANAGILFSSTARKDLGRRLDNAGMATWTAGEIWVTAGGVITNLAGATFDAQSDATMSAPFNSGVFNNFGTFIKSGGTGTTSIGTYFNNSGTVEVRSGTLRFYNPGSASTSTSSGRFVGLAGTSLVFTSAGATMTATSSISAPAVFFSVGGFSVQGNYQVTDSTTCSGGTTNFTGNVISVGNLLKITGGTANFSNTSVTIAVPTLRLSGGILTGSSLVTVSSLGAWTGGTIQGSGKKRVLANATMNITGSNQKTWNGGTFENEGRIIWTGTGDIRGRASAKIINLSGGSIEIQNAEPFFFNAGDGGRPNLSNAGNLTKSVATGTTELQASFTNTGTVEVRSGTLRFTGGFTQTAGSTTLNGGNLSGSVTLNFQGGSLSGPGTITANVSTAGQVNPGVSAGVLNVTGNYTQTAAGSLNMEIGGLTAGSQHDQLTISGTATLAGILNLTRINNFTPSLGNTFVIVAYGSHGTSQFTTINGLNIGGGLRFQPIYNPTNLTLQVVSGQAEQ